MTTHRDIVVFDIDGTLADIDHRIRRIHPDSPPHWDPAFDWKGFFVLFEDDKPIEWTVQLAMILKQHVGMKLFIFTGRSEVVREETESWLLARGLNFDTLLMRSREDFRLDEEIKPDLLAPFRDRISFVVEDRVKITLALRENGYNVMQCAHCEY